MSDASDITLVRKDNNYLLIRPLPAFRYCVAFTIDVDACNVPR